MMLSIISSQFRQSKVSQLMLPSITLSVQLCLPRPPRSKAPSPTWTSILPQGEKGSGGCWEVGAAAMPFISLVVLLGMVLKEQAQAQHQYRLELV